MNQQVYEEASEWLVELRTDDPGSGTRKRFQDWLNTSPVHVQAYLELAALWEDSSGIDRARAIDANSLIALAQTERNIHPLDFRDRSHLENQDTAAAPPPNNRGISGSHTSRRLFAVAATILVSLCAGGWYWDAYVRGVHFTDVGQQRTLALPDGTTVELNADTRIRERYTETQRTIELLQGQALFRVAKNPNRPFVVESGSAVVRAVGTQFDVHRRPSGTTVTVLEGRVAVAQWHDGLPAISRGQDAIRLDDARGRSESEKPRHEEPLARTFGSSREILLSAGEQILATAISLEEPKPVNIEITTAWTQQRLVFEADSLVDAADEFNRFNNRQLIVNPNGLEDFRVNGTFPAFDPQSLSRFVQFLRAQPGINVIESDDRIIVVKK